MSNTNAMENENDPVVKEIPVFLSKTLAEKLFIFQYPVRPAKEGYDNATVLKSSIKPQNQEVLMEVAIDTHSVNYDQSKGEQIAINADGDARSEQDDDDRAFDSHFMDKTVLQSSRVLPNCSNYAVGVFQDGELHLTPVTGVVQMRPQFNYLDKSDKRVREEAKNMGEELDEEEEGPKQVNVTFARQKPEFMKKMQEQSFQHHTQKSLEERWIHTNYIPTNSTQAELTRLEMYCSATDETVNTLNLSMSQYLELLAPRMKEEQYVKTDISNTTTSLNYIRTLPLLDQIRTLLKDAKVISFVQLRSILSPDQETAAILKYLQQVAVLVQGNWVVSSELVYPKESISSYNGIPAELMCRARDYILLSFTEHEYLDRKTISSVVKLPPEEIKEIFTNLAIHEPKKGWRLIIPPVKDFIERYPEIAQRQEMFWEAKRKHLREAMEVQNQVPQRQRRKSNRESVGSENEEKNVGRGRKTLRDSSMSDNDSATEPVKHKKTIRSRKVSETT
ncbi:PREDICTED: DNA-directed RNA polymerase III subunit RPC5 [Dufourea novaeangliae]|uniref:DNA-directed RNA polymerase III subunit RPC5 n=1 Tax=Dufourea novaeangliae TaxID=178035 RepID=A0A154P2P4_DUFNO|nr:PREDICTED: DNA-directed RNA polymerase III subunit RPC5 [Dufourea novaeangliae]KZC05614.1 DNA-directed RNA polymerase III subunit RPC5 [Dufourea novaeangliae]